MREEWKLVPVKPTEAMIKASDFVSSRSALETWEGYLSAVPEVPKACLDKALGLMLGLLDWNRAQPQPLIAVGYEYGVVSVLLGMMPEYDGQPVGVVEVWDQGTSSLHTTVDLVGPPLAHGTKLFLQSNASEVELLKNIAESAAERLRIVEQERDTLLAKVEAQAELLRQKSNSDAPKTDVVVAGSEPAVEADLTEVAMTLQHLAVFLEDTSLKRRETLNRNPSGKYVAANIASVAKIAAGFLSKVKSAETVLSEQIRRMPPRDLPVTYALAAKALREHETVQWLGSKGHHTGFVAAAVFLEKLAEEGSFVGSRGVESSALCAASAPSEGERL